MRRPRARRSDSVIGAESGAADTLKDAVHLLLDQARIIEGEPVTDPAAYAKRMSHIMTAELGG